MFDERHFQCSCGLKFETDDAAVNRQRAVGHVMQWHVRKPVERYDFDTFARRVLVLIYNSYSGVGLRITREEKF
jgi:hypothetical protein